MRNSARAAPPDSPGHPLEPFYRGLGHVPIFRHGTLWYDAGRFSLVTFPSNRKVAATRAEIQRLLVDSGKLAAVFCPLSGTGPTIHDYWIDDKGYGPHRLQQQFAQHVRKHARRFVARDLSWSELASGATGIHADVVARRKIEAPGLSDPIRWAGTCRAASGIPGLTAFGCLIEGALAAYVIGWQEGGICHGVLTNRNSRFDAHRAGNVLLHAFTAARIHRPEVSAITMGRSWYPPKPSLDRFKRHAGYDERETTVAVVLHPRIEPFLRASWLQRLLGGIDRLVRPRLGLEADLQLVQAARQTELP